LSVKRKLNVLNKTNIDISYFDPFDYIFIVITKIDLFKDYMDTTHIDEGLKLITWVVIPFK
jgi:hypothetical protein